jgi:hypothetical protein
MKLKYTLSVSIYTFFNVFVINNKNQLTTNSEIHNKNSRQLNNFHQPRHNLSKHLKGSLYLGIKVYNNLTSCTENRTTQAASKSVQKTFYSYTLFIP